jgi:predicted RNase H-like HicB family nuclease
MELKYRAVFTPEKGSRWSVSAPEIRGCHSWGRSLSEARRNILDAIATNIEIDGGDGDRVRREAKLVEELNAPIARVVERARHVRSALEDAVRQANEETEKAVAALTAKGLSLRDVGDLLGLSHQRIQQLITQRKDAVAPRRARSRKAAGGLRRAATTRSRSTERA